MDIHQRTLPSAARSRAAAAIVQFCSAGMVALGLSFPADATLFTVANLVTDDQAVNHAQITDPKLINAWGISHSASSPFWVSDNGTGFATLYSVNPMTGAVAGFQWALLGGQLPTDLLAVSAAVSTVLLLVGLAYFRRTERTFADVI